MALAGKINEVYVLDGVSEMTASTGKAISGADNSTFNRLCELLDVSSFGDDYRKRIAGLLDSSISVSGNYDPTDTDGQGVLVAGASIYIGVYPQGSGEDGVQIPAIVENFEVSADVAGKQEFSASVQATSEPVTLPAQT